MLRDHANASTARFVAGSHPRTSPRSPSRSRRTASLTFDAGISTGARSDERAPVVSFAVLTRGTRRVAPERSDTSCGDVRRRWVSRALRSARAARRASARRRRAAALLKVEKDLWEFHITSEPLPGESVDGRAARRLSFLRLRSDGVFHDVQGSKELKSQMYSVIFQTTSTGVAFFADLSGGGDLWRCGGRGSARRSIKRRPAERSIPLYKSPPCVLEPAHYPLTTPFP